MRRVGTRAEAHAIAEDHLRGMGSNEPLALLDMATQEHAWGWIFFYSSRRFVETLDDRYGLVGNGSLLIERGTGRVWPLGTAHGVEHYIDNYTRTGDPHLEPGRTVALLGSTAGADAVSAIAVIRSLSDAPLPEVKRIVASCLAGRTARVEARDRESAERMAAALAKCCFRARCEADTSGR